MKEYIRKLILFYIILIFVPLFPIWRVLNKGIISYIDFEFNFNALKALNDYLYVWNPVNNGTYISVGNVFYEMLYFFQYFLTDILHLPASLASTLIIYIPLFLYLLSLYKFINYIVFNDSNQSNKFNLIALYLAILGFLSTTTMIYLSFGWANGALLQVSACLFSIYYFLRSIDENKKHYLIIASLLTIVAATLLQYLLISFFLLFLIVIFKYNSKKAYLSYLIYLFLFIFLNIFWIGNFIISNIFFNVSYYKFNLQSVIQPSLDPIIFLKSFALINEGTNLSVLGYITNLLNFRIALILFFNLVCLSGLFFIKKNKYILVFGILFVACVQMILRGDSHIYVFLFKYIPFFEMFRSIDKFYIYINLSLIILLAFAYKYIQEIYEIKKIIKIILGSILLIISLMTSYPLISGNLNGLIHPFKLPNYYNEIYEYDVNKLKNIDGNIYIMPNPFLFSQFSWISHKYQQIANPLRSLLESPVIYDEFNNINLNPLQTILFNKTHQDFDLSNAGFYNILSILNIKAILIQNDQIRPSISKLNNKQIIEKFNKNLETENFIIKKYGDLTLLQLQDKYTLPIIFIPKNLILSNLNLQKTIEIIPNNLDNKIAIFDTTDKKRLISSLTFKKVGILEIIASSSSASINFNKINNTKYEINLKQASGVLPVVFSQNYNNGWKLYLNKSNKHILDFLKPNIKEIDHFKVNGYSNLWLIPIDEICNNINNCKKNENGTYDLTLNLEFLPQKIFYIGEIISLSTLIFCIYLIYYYRRKVK